ncbi:UDP-2,4-diacetamido-2,4,6-trideoxy-beta-L-altropyranose hydrolase [Desulfogranum mediterraneum]|uniref:UDP-2,4-diacetamido-2,4, 6-trideoxy-beta-L-altropyranose hydrolase n=1 Tax=Desulfogranum mediterraneum TaxID=160661 RepID=UPI000414B227|nr:UDP-2,4-diacetamido-2,4,6-trideoxy-beta-L-altropyranose hydrolase [Desulfogranum mediterraneum]
MDLSVRDRHVGCPKSKDLLFSMMFLSNPHLLIRADANPQIGTGHAMRCLALAQAWIDRGGRVTYLMSPDGGPLGNRIIDEGVKIKNVACEPGSREDAAVTYQICSELKAKMLVIDGYHFLPEYQKYIYSQATRSFDIMIIDDNADRDSYYADYLLNQNFHASLDLYKESQINSSLKFFLGPGYCLLRRGFATCDLPERNSPHLATRLLVSMGGSDPDNVTSNVLRALKERTGGSRMAVKVIVGSNNIYTDEIFELAAENIWLEIIVGADDQQMIEAMTWADFALSAAGSTVLELCQMRLPCLLVAIAENQVQIANYAVKTGIACDAFYWKPGNKPVELVDRLIHNMADQGIRKDCISRMEKLNTGMGCGNLINDLMK